MIQRYSEHAANERTYLAWVRTGIAVIAFGFVIEKFNLFVRATAISASAGAAGRLQLDRLTEALGRYDGTAIILMGLVLIVVQTARFARTGRLLDDAEPHDVRSVRTELVFSAVLVLLVTSYATYLALD